MPVRLKCSNIFRTILKWRVCTCMSSAGKQIIFLSLDDLLQRLMSYQFTDKLTFCGWEIIKLYLNLVDEEAHIATNVHQLITFFFCLGLCRTLAHNRLHRLEKGTFKDLMNLQELYFVSFYLDILAFSVGFSFCWSAM